MTDEGVPEPVRLDPGSGSLPPELGQALNDPDQPILLLVSADAGEAALRTAVALAEARGARGLSTILGDAGVGDPRLHPLLDVDNLEGFADLVLFGASLQRILTRPPTRSFAFAPAGMRVPDPAHVLDSPRWDRLAADLEEQGTLLLLFVPAGTPGLGALSRRAGRAVLIGHERELARAADWLDPACEIVAAVEPLAAITVAALAAGAGPAAGPGTATIFDAPGLTEPLVIGPTGKRASRGPSLLLLLALLAALGAGGWFLYHEYLAGPPAGTAIQLETTPAPRPVRGEPVETPLPISVAVEAHQDLANARQRVAALRRAEREIDFYLAPVAVNGVLYYRLLAGPVVDREAGTRLLQRLVDANHKTAFDSWAVRPTQFAFHLGEFDTRQEAAARVASLAELEVPSYTVTVRYEPGDPRFRVYGGAYESAGEAEVMAELLRNARVEAELVPRTGEPIP